MTDERIGGNTYENTYETHAYMQTHHMRRREQNRRFGCCSDTHSWFALLLGAGRLGAGARALLAAPLVALWTTGGACRLDACRVRACSSAVRPLACRLVWRSGVTSRGVPWFLQATLSLARCVDGRGAFARPRWWHVDERGRTWSLSLVRLVHRLSLAFPMGSTCAHVPAPRTHSKRCAACACCFTFSCVRTGSSACSPGFCHRSNRFCARAPPAALHRSAFPARRSPHILFFRPATLGHCRDAEYFSTDVRRHWRLERSSEWRAQALARHGNVGVPIFARVLCDLCV
jgi:hypothetical protein